VLAHRAGRDPKGLRDLGVRPPCGDEVEDLPLAFREGTTALLFLEQQGTVHDVDGN